MGLPSQVSGWGLKTTQAQKSVCGDHRQSSVRESLRKEVQKSSDRNCAHGKATSQALTGGSRGHEGQKDTCSED